MTHQRIFAAFLGRLLFPLLIAAPAFAQQISENAVLLSRLAPQGMTGYAGVWGYASEGREYALIGHYNGVSVIDVTAPAVPVEVSFISGPTSLWREIKTHDHYACVTNETSSGLQIIDLKNLPASAASAGYYDLTFRTAHTLYIDNGYAYIAGSNTAQGINILDLANPTRPVEVGSWTARYWHDVIVKNDTLYGSAIYDGAIEIVDGRNKSDLRLISFTPYPNGFTHNIWITADNRYLSQTDEVHDQPVNFWDVSDHRQPKLLASYHAGPRSIAHNTHVLGDFAFISYYYDGLKVIDISQRTLPIEVANYDTFADDNFQRGGGYEGAWGAYPFLPSGNILVSDRTYGLFVVQFNGTRAGYVRGRVFDRDTNARLTGVKVENLNNTDGSTSISFAQDNDTYLAGAKPGSHSFKFSKYGYEDFTLADISLESGVVQERDVYMSPLPSAAIAIQVETSFNEPIPGARVVIKNEDFRAELRTNNSGSASLTVPLGTYRVALSQWGFLPSEEVVVLTGVSSTQVTLETEPGYVDSFTESVGWELRGLEDQSAYDWIIEPLANETYGSRLPHVDHTGDPEGFAAMSRARNGASSLTSPVFDATRLNDPHLRFARFFNPYSWSFSQANDTLKILISNDNGLSWKVVDAFTAIDVDWRVVSYRLTDHIAPSAQMRARLMNIEGFDLNATRASSFAAIDDFEIVPGRLVEVFETEPHVPGDFELLQNYPNPFNPQTTLRWRQPEISSAHIEIYGALGQRLAEYDTPMLAPGLHSLVLDFSGFASGVYLYRIQVNDRLSDMKKLLLMK